MNFNERRATPRVTLDSLVSSGPGSTRLKGRAFDISLGGLGLVCVHELRAGSEYEVSFELPSRSRDQPPVDISTLGRVLYCVPIGEADAFRVGLAFLGLDEDAEHALRRYVQASTR